MHRLIIEQKARRFFKMSKKCSHKNIQDDPDDNRGGSRIKER